MLVVSCFEGGEVHLPMTMEGARQLQEAMQTRRKAPLANLILLHAAAAPRVVPPFHVCLVAGSGPTTAEFRQWDRRMRRVAAQHGLELWASAADGSVGPRQHWLLEHIVLNHPSGGTSARFRQTADMDLREGERAVAIHSPHHTVSK